MRQPLVGDGGQQQRPFKWLPQQVLPGMGLRQIGQRLRAQSDLVKSFAVMRQRQALVGTAFQVGPGMCFQMLARQCGVVGQIADMGRNLRQRRLDGLTCGIHMFRCHASDHMRRRL